MDKKYFEDYLLQAKTEEFAFESKYKKWLFFIDTQNLIFFPRIKNKFPKLFENPTAKLQKEIDRLPKNWENGILFKREDMYGSRSNGKTYNWVLYHWYLDDLFPTLKFNFVWTRVRLKECFEIYRTILMLAPNEFQKRLRQTNYDNKNHKNKIRISRDELIIEYKTTEFRILNLIGKNDSIHQEDHSLLGWELGHCDIRFLMFEESYRMNEGMRTSAGVICRNNKILFRINVLNNYSYKSSLIKDLDTNLPFDGYKMGKNYIQKIEDYKNPEIMKKIQGFQYKEIEHDKRVIWKLNHIPMLRANLIDEEYVEELWFQANRDPLRKDVILWGKTGALETGMFTNYMKKIVNISIEKNIQDFRNNPNYINGYLMIGIDMGYTFDKTVATIVTVSSDFKKIRLLSTKIIKAKTTVLDIENQMLSIVDFVQRKLKLYGYNFKEYWVSVNTIHAVQLSIETKFKRIFGDELFYFYNFKKPLPLLERTNFLKEIIANNNFEVVNSSTNQYFKTELENLTYGNIDIPSHIKRLGEDDVVEAFENAIFPIFNKLKSVLHLKIKTH